MVLCRPCRHQICLILFFGCFAVFQIGTLIVFNKHYFTVGDVSINKMEVSKQIKDLVARFEKSYHNMSGKGQTLPASEGPPQILAAQLQNMEARVSQNINSSLQKQNNEMSVGAPQNMEAFSHAQHQTSSSKNHTLGIEQENKLMLRQQIQSKPVQKHKYDDNDLLSKDSFDFSLTRHFGLDGILQPVVGTDYKFYVFSAYHDRRVAGKEIIRVIAVTTTR